MCVRTFSAEAGSVRVQININTGSSEKQPAWSCPVWKKTGNNKLQSSVTKSFYVVCLISLLLVLPSVGPRTPEKSTSTRWISALLCSTTSSHLYFRKIRCLFTLIFSVSPLIASRGLPSCLSPHMGANLTGVQALTCEGGILLLWAALHALKRNHFTPRNQVTLLVIRERVYMHCNNLVTVHIEQASNQISFLSLCLIWKPLVHGPELFNWWPVGQLRPFDHSLTVIVWVLCCSLIHVLFCCFSPLMCHTLLSTSCPCLFPYPFSAYRFLSVITHLCLCFSCLLLLVSPLRCHFYSPVVFTCSALEFSSVSKFSS